MNEPLPRGIYELLHTRRVDADLAAQSLAPDFVDIGDGDTPVVLSRHLADALVRHLSALKPADQVARANELLGSLDETDEVLRPELLVALRNADEPKLQRPATPLSEVALLTNTKGEPNMAGEIAHELASADSVDLLCAFIKFAGISVLGQQLGALRERGVQPRVLTTTYCGATERRALDTLVTKYGAHVKVRYETRSTRLHAKAWLFRRRSGFDTGYVGSSNLSHSAMVDGLEWNVRISGVSTPSLTRKFEATFDTYWNDPAFKDYDPSTDADLLDRALAEAGGTSQGRQTLTVSGLDVRPYPHQERILEALDVERQVHDRHRNLVVAATGTGKTVVAALDYRGLCERAGTRLPLLFVAHRKEILEQSLRMYREVLADATFGEMFVGGQRPTQWKHVFASIQSLHSNTLAGIDPTQFDVVVVDEFHHAEASTYRRLLDHLEPAELLGLTATPERTDGRDVFSWFDGRIAYELRLWDALEQDLLCPFHYYGVADNTDLRPITWSRGNYQSSDLSNLYTGNDARTRLVLQALRDKVSDPTAMRALGFCVSIAHAEYMATRFTQQGLPSLAVSAETSPTDRADAFAKLRAGTVKCLFGVDVFNEGLDIPDVDTILLLRPTQSATVFLQQLGRGLRRTKTKAVLTVLDFIGQQRREFRFENKFRALTGSSRGRLLNEISEDFPFLPGGSRLVLDRVAQEIITENIRQTIRLNRRADLVASIASHKPRTLQEYLTDSGHDLVDVYGGTVGKSWTALARDAHIATAAPGPGEEAMLHRIRIVTHVDDLERAKVYRKMPSPTAPDTTSCRPASRRTPVCCSSCCGRTAATTRTTTPVSDTYKPTPPSATRSVRSST
nr:DEAD/DEAH box helicase family protein [Williamsia sp. D3]